MQAGLQSDKVFVLRRASDRRDLLHRDEAKRNRDAERCEVNNFTFPVAMRPGVTPVPIPNTMVKPGTADGTALETVWESRRLPESTFTQKCVNHEP